MGLSGGETSVSGVLIMGVLFVFWLEMPSEESTGSVNLWKRGSLVRLPDVSDAFLECLFPILRCRPSTRES